MTVRRDPPSEAELAQLKAKFFRAWNGVRAGANTLGPAGLQACAVEAREMRVTAATLSQWRREWTARTKG